MRMLQWDRLALWGGFHEFSSFGLFQKRKTGHILSASLQASASCSLVFYCDASRHGLGAFMKGALGTLWSHAPLPLEWILCKLCFAPDVVSFPELLCLIIRLFGSG